MGRYLFNDAGAQLHLEDGADSDSGRLVQNNSVISGSSLAYRHGLACYSSVDRNNMIGEWKFPDGSGVGRETADSQQVLFAHHQIGRVTLQVREGQQFTSQLSQQVCTPVWNNDFGNTSPGEGL